MALAEQLAERARQWEEFHRWEGTHPVLKRDPAAVLADLGAIWQWLPEDVRLQDPDPDKLGIQCLRQALAVLSKCK